MGAAVALRQDYGAEDLRRSAGKVKDARQARRLLALAAIYDGKDRAEAARIGAMDRQTLRDWVHRFNAKGPDGLRNAKPPGRPSKLSAEQKGELERIVEAGPDLEKDRVVRWRCVDLRRVINERFGVDLDEVSIGRLLKELNFSHVSARPQHPKQDAAVMAMKEVAPGTPIELWFQDEMRVGQKNGLVYQWAKKGTRPRQPKDQRYETAYLFGAFCASRDAGVGLILPRADTAAMQMHIEAIARTVKPGAHALVLFDQAGWHTTKKLRLPSNLTLLPLPSASPELNPAENIWEFLRHNYLSAQVFNTYTDILNSIEDAWRKLMNEVGRVASITSREWAVIDQCL